MKESNWSPTIGSERRWKEVSSLREKRVARRRLMVIEWSRRGKSLKEK